MDRRHRTVLLGGLLVSELGSSASDVVVAWLVLAHTGSVTKTGLVWASSSLATLLAGPLGGAVADLLPRRAVMIGADVIRTLVIAALGFAMLSGWFWLPAVLAAVFVNAFLNLTFEGALQALVPAMAGDALEAFNGRLQAARLVGALAGPALGGILLAASSRPATALLVDAFSYLVSIAAVASIRVAEPARQAAGERRPLLGAVGVIWRTPQLRRLTTLAVSLSALFPLYTVALPLIARATCTGGGGYGLLSSALVLGMAVGSLTAGVAIGRVGGERTIVAGLAAGACATVMLAWSPSYAAALVAVTAIGLAAGPVDVVFFSGIQRAAPADWLGRASAQVISLISLVRAPAFAVAGAGFAATGTTPLLVACAVAELAGAGVYLLTASSTETTLSSSAVRS